MKISQRKMHYHWFIVGIITATLGLTVSANYNDYPTECPKIDPINYTILLPHETDCTKFYMCFHGKKILMLCPLMDLDGNRLHFNPKLHVCDYPEDAGCEIKSTTTEIPTSSTIKSTSKSTATSTTIHSTTQKHGHTHKTSTTMKISTSSSLSPSTSTSSTTTNPTEEVSTTTPLPTTIEETTLPTTEEVETTTNSPSILALACTKNMTQVYFPHNSRPDIYYECSNGDLIRRECSKNLVFDSSQQMCIEPSNINYRSALVNLEMIIDPTDSSYRATLCNSSDSNSQCERYPHECDCNKYYICSNGNAILRICPANLRFNPSLKECDLPGNIACNGDTITPNNTIPTTCPSDNSGWAVHLPHETNCSLFYKCNWGQKVELPCKPGLYFNPKLQVCDYPCAAGCTAEGGSGMNTCHSIVYEDNGIPMKEEIIPSVDESENLTHIDSR